MMAVKGASETLSSQNPLTGSACLPLAALQFAPGGFIKLLPIGYCCCISQYWKPKHLGAGRLPGCTSLSQEGAIWLESPGDQVRTKTLTWSFFNLL